jgi:hypothetical protein
MNLDIMRYLVPYCYFTFSEQVFVCLGLTQTKRALGVQSQFFFTRLSVVWALPNKASQAKKDIWVHSLLAK